MKKIVLLSTLLFLLTTVFAQQKNVTFIDTLFKPISPVYYSNFYLTNSNNSVSDGYFYGTKYDDSTYDLKCLIGRTDFKGELIWDSVYYFEPLFGNGWEYDGITLLETNSGVLGYTSSQSVNADHNREPFLFKLSDSGDVEWNYFYSIDSLTFYTNDVIQTQDDGYLIAGKMNDWNASTVLSYQYGFLDKTDNMGGLEWSKWYANKDTIEFWFESVAQSTNGNYIVAGNAINNKMSGQGKGDPGTWDNFLNIASLDANGDLLWNKALHFDSIVDNQYSYYNFLVTLIDDQTAIVSFQFVDTVNYYEDMGIISLNYNNGDINWVRGYSLASNSFDIEPQKVFTSTNNTLLVYVRESQEGFIEAIYEFDMLGNFISSTSISDQSNDILEYFDLISSNDGGFLISYNNWDSNEAAFSFIKTDNQLINTCGNTNGALNPSSFDLTYTFYTIIDTIIDVAPNVGSLNVSPDSIVDFSRSLACECNIVIDGTVIDPDMGSPTDSVLVTLYRFDPTPGQYIIHDTISTDASGYYYFDYLPEGQYVIKAEPSSVKYPDFVKTYYNSMSVVTQWDSSEVVFVQCGMNPMQYNITLFKAVPQTGMWQCSGYVFEYDGFTPFAKKAPGDPIPDIDITVEQSPGGAISSTTTDNDGFFHFTGLNNNATFIVRADVPGLPNDSIYTFTVNPGDGALDSLNFYVDSVGVYIIPDGLVGVKEQFNSLKGFDIVPNPTTGQFNLTMNVNENSQIAVKIVNLVGDEVLNQTLNVNVGETKATFDMRDYSSGIYFVRITQGESYLIKKLVKQ